MPSYVFDYKTFYNFYTNPSNYYIDSDPVRPTIMFYPYDTNVPEKYKTPPINKNLPSTYILVNGKQVYLTIHGHNELFFTIPRKDKDGQLWDDHYHFGLDRLYDTKTRAYYDVNFFHKTIQNTHKIGKEHERCYIRDKVTITDVSDISCFESKTGKKMRDEFKDPDLSIIAQIINRPFIGNDQTAGAFKKFILGRMRNVRKVGRKSMITYKGKQISLTEARALEKLITNDNEDNNQDQMIENNIDTRVRDPTVVVERFMEEHKQLYSNNVLRSVDVYENFNTWLNRNKEQILVKRMSHTAFTQRLKVLFAADTKVHRFPDGVAQAIIFKDLVSSTPHVEELNAGEKVERFVKQIVVKTDDRNSYIKLSELREAFAQSKYFNGTSSIQLLKKFAKEIAKTEWITQKNIGCERLRNILMGTKLVTP